jgi:hypothetical protein
MTHSLVLHISLHMYQSISFMTTQKQFSLSLEAEWFSSKN